MDRADLRELESDLLQAVATVVTQSGFKLRRSFQDYVKTIPGGRWGLHLAFMEHDEDFDVTADVAIRVDAVEDLVHDTDRRLSAKEKRETATAGAELGNLVDGRQHRWTIVAADDVEAVAASICKMFADFGLPYLKRLTDLNVLLELLGRNDVGGWLHSPFHGSRCKRAVALALVLGEPEKALELAQAGERYLNERKDFSLREFRTFVQRVLA
jgi:hypothetical protein